MYYLYLKTHNVTGLKYLGKTEQEDQQSYKGSGIYWKRHIKKYGYDVKTDILFTTEDKKEFKKVAEDYSRKFNIIKSKEFANCILEQGDGGDTVSSKMWITNGTIDKYINKSDEIPEGWKRGRCRCVFNDPKKQKEFGALADHDKKSRSMKLAWKTNKNLINRDHSKCGGHSHTQETKDKLRVSALSRSEELSERAKKNKFWEKSGRWK